MDSGDRCWTIIVSEDFLWSLRRESDDDDADGGGGGEFKSDDADDAIRRLLPFLDFMVAGGH